MNTPKWTELARAEGELQILRARFSVAKQNADHPSARQIILAIARAEKGREEMVTIITDTVAADR
jgi:hypothetical protein